MKGKNAKMKALEEEMAALKALAAEDDDDEEETDENNERETDTEDDDDDKDDKKASAQLISLVQELTGSKNLSAASGKLAALVARGAAGAVTARAELVALAIKSGKMPPALKSWAMKCNEKTFAEFVKGLGGAKALTIGRKHTPPADSEETEEETEPTAAPRAGGLSKSETVVAKAFSFDAKTMIGLRNKPVRRGLAAERGE
jgi:hypothetical protein